MTTKFTVNSDSVFIFEKVVAQKKGSRKEVSEAIEFFSFAKERYPEIKPVFFHVANEGDFPVGYRVKLKKMGVLSGVSDYILLMPSGAFNFACIEMKRSCKSESSVKDSQSEFLLNAAKNGGFAAICYGRESAMAALEFYLK